MILVGMCMLFGGVMNGCSPLRKTIIEYKTEYVKKDSLVIRDSVIVVPVEKIVNIAPDTLFMETSLAKAKAYLDTSINMLRGTLENKQQVIYKTKYVDKWHTKDSLVYKEVPVEVEKPVYKHYPYEKYLWVYFFLTLAGFGIIIYMKIMKH